MSELNIGGSNMVVELRDEDKKTLYAKAETGNKQWVAVLTDTHPKYNYDRDFVAYQKPRTSDRDSGTTEVDDGAVIERVRYAHSGKNRKNRYYQLVDDEAHEIDEIDIEAAIGGEIIPDIEDEMHTCGECGREFDGEHGLAVHKGMVHKDITETNETDEQEETTARSTTTNQTIVADGGKDFREFEEIRHTDAKVRHYSADGMLYAYREEDQHVIVSRGREPATKWSDRVPANRTHVIPGERLWTIPDNWDLTHRISTDTDRKWEIYHIPETDIDVKINVPMKNQLIDAWYRVLSVGESAVKFADELDRDAAQQTLEQVSESGEYDDLVIEGLRDLIKRDYRWNAFVRKFEESVAEFGPQALQRGDEPAQVSVSGSDPWGDHYRIDDIVYDVLGPSVKSNRSVVRHIEDLLHEQAVPTYPSVIVSIDSDNVGADYCIRALVQAGCSPTEAIDWYYVENNGLSQTEWANERDCDQSTVSGNIKQAKRRLLSR